MLSLVVPLNVRPQRRFVAILIAIRRDPQGRLEIPHDLQVSMNCRSLIIALCTRPSAVFNGQPSILAMSTNFILL
jgi:hypothetical protein